MRLYIANTSNLDLVCFTEDCLKYIKTHKRTPEGIKVNTLTIRELDGNIEECKKTIHCLLNPLFDPFKPETFSKTILPPPTRDEIGLRFAPMREMITLHKSTISKGAKYDRVEELQDVEIIGTHAAQESDEYIKRWEKMICQLSSNAYELFTTLNPNLNISPNCYWNGETWIAETNQCADIQVINALDSDGNWLLLNEEGFEVTYETAIEDDKLLEYSINGSLNEEGIYGIQLDNIILLETIYDKDGEPRQHIFVTKNGVLKPFIGSSRRARYGDNVYVVKIVVPGHFTIATVYPTEKRIEFFDSGGSFGKVGWRYDDPNVPYSLTLLARHKTRYSEEASCIVEGASDDDVAVCMGLKKIFPEYDFVALNTMNLQFDDRDAHCQSWIFLFVYMKFVYPRITTKEILEFFHSLSSEQTYNLVDNWWKFLINFIPENHEELFSELIKNYDTIIE